MIRKRDFINFIFVLSLPIYGLGCYLGRIIGPARGIAFNLSPFLLIVVFYLIDILYKRDFQVKVKGNIYWWMMAYIFSIILSLWVGLYKGTPLVSLSTAIGTSLIYLVVFHAFIIVFLYNGDKSDEVIPRLIFISMGILLFMSVVGYYIFGFNAGSTFYDGVRDDLPFFQGAFEAGNMAAIMSLFTIWLIIKAWNKPIKVVLLVCVLMVLFFILVRVNSRIAILIMMLTLGLFAIKWAKNYLVFWISLFTLPLVLNLRYVLYLLLSIPMLKPIMVRTDYEDIMTLDGRTILWQRGLDWLMYDQRGIFFGNGHQGQYFLSLLRDIQLVWHPVNPHIMHWHSASLEILVNQGLLGYILLLIVMYKVFGYYRKEYLNNSKKGMFFLAVVYLLFNAQIDTFIIWGTTGTILLWLLVAGATVKTSQNEKQKVSSLPEPEAVHA